MTVCWCFVVVFALLLPLYCARYTETCGATMDFPLCQEFAQSCRMFQRPVPHFFQSPQNDQRVSGPCRSYDQLYANYTAQRSNINPSIKVTEVHLNLMVHFDLSFTDSPRCVLAHWYCKIIPCHVELNKGLAAPIPLTVPAWVLYFALTCHTTLESWFPSDYRGLCTAQTTDLIDQYILHGFLDWTRATFYSVGDFDFQWQIDAVFKASLFLDSRYNRSHITMMVQDSGLSQSLLDDAAAAGVEYIFVGMNPLSYYPANATATLGNSTYGGVDLMATKSDGTVIPIRTFFHPLSYGNVVCDSDPLLRSGDTCELSLNKTESDLRLFGFQIVKKQRTGKYAALVTIIMNENTGSPLQAAALYYPGGWDGLKARIWQTLSDRGWLDPNATMHVGTLEDFFMESAPLLPAPTFPLGWIPAQQWAPVAMSDPLLTAVYKRVAGFLDESRPSGDDPFLAQQLALLAMVEHNYAIPGYTTIDYDGIRQKRQWFFAWNQTHLWDEMWSAVQETKAPQPPAPAGLRSCGRLGFNITSSNQLLGITFDGRQIWQGTSLNINGSTFIVPLLHLSYDFRPDPPDPSSIVNLTSPFKPGFRQQGNECNFIFATDYSLTANSLAAGKKFRVTTVLSYPVTSTGSVINVEIIANTTDAVVQQIRDSLVVFFAPTASGAALPWSVRQRHGSFERLDSIGGPCSGRYRVLPFVDRSSAPTASNGPFKLESWDSPVAVVPDTLSFIATNTSVVRISTALGWDSATYLAAPNFNAGLGIVLWEDAQCCWAPAAPMVLPGQWETWGGRLHWKFNLTGPTTLPEYPKQSDPIPWGTLVSLGPKVDYLQLLTLDAMVRNPVLNVRNLTWVPPPPYPWVPLMLASDRVFVLINTLLDSTETLVLSVISDLTFATSPRNLTLNAGFVRGKLRPTLTRDSSALLMVTKGYQENALRLHKMTLDTGIVTKSAPLDSFLGPYSPVMSYNVMEHPSLIDTFLVLTTSLSTSHIIYVISLSGNLLGTIQCVDSSGRPCDYIFITSYAALLGDSIFFINYKNPPWTVIKLPIPAQLNTSVSATEFPTPLSRVAYFPSGGDQPNLWVDSKHGWVVIIASPPLDSAPPYHPFYTLVMDTSGAVVNYGIWDYIGYNATWPMGLATTYFPGAS